MDIFKNTDVKPEELSPLILAFTGDCVYELLVRNMVVSKGNRAVNKMSAETRSFVNAGTQSEMYEVIKDMLTDEEENVYRRGRNAKSHSKAKNQTIVTYRRATGIEALFGYLYLKGEFDRLTLLFETGIDRLENENEKKG